jgi:hypothetical protein
MDSEDSYLLLGILLTVLLIFMLCCIVYFKDVYCYRSRNKNNYIINNNIDNKKLNDKLLDTIVSE